jgi:AcrR family transcriptional regulator
MARTRNDRAFGLQRRKILDAAEALFAEGGFHQTGMAAICAAAGMSPGALYRYFPSKAAIIRGIVEDEAREAAAWIGAVESAKDVTSALVDALDTAIVEVSAPGYRRLALEIAAEAARDPEIGAVMEAAENDLLTRIASAVTRAGNAEAAAANAETVLMLLNGALSAGARFAALPAAARRERLAKIVSVLTA